MDYEMYEDIWEAIKNRENGAAVRQELTYQHCLERIRYALEDWFYGPYKR